MAAFGIGIHQIGEQKALPVGLFQKVDGGLQAGLVADGMVGLGKAPVIENILDLAHAQHVEVFFLQNVQQGIPRGIQGEIPAIPRAHEGARFAFEGTGDDPAHRVFAHQ